MDTLIEAVKGLLRDIDSMRVVPDDSKEVIDPNLWFGEFEEFQVSGGNWDSIPQASIEWPNLHLSVQNVMLALAEIGELEGVRGAIPRYDVKLLEAVPNSCPSNHWNDGADTCADCGKDLQG